METSVLSFVVPGISCGHCVRAITEEVSQLIGVAEVHADVDTKVVVVTGRELQESVIREAIVAAGYEATP